MLNRSLPDSSWFFRVDFTRIKRRFTICCLHCIPKSLVARCCGTKDSSHRGSWVLTAHEYPFIGYTVHLYTFYYFWLLIRGESLTVFRVDWWFSGKQTHSKYEIGNVSRILFRELCLLNIWNQAQDGIEYAMFCRRAGSVIGVGVLWAACSTGVASLVRP